MQSNDRSYKILLYKSTLSFAGGLPDGLSVVTSPLSCLSEATEGHYNLIVVFLDYRSLRERDALVDLCSKLNNNRYTMHIPLIAVLPSRHRKLLERLQDAGVKYVKFYDQRNLNSKSGLETFVVSPTEECRIDRALSNICPYITYFPINRHQEILYCGAYRNRLVLGPYRLSNYCETANYKTCQYVNDPKFLKNV